MIYGRRMDPRVRFTIHMLTSLFSEITERISIKFGIGICRLEFHIFSKKISQHKKVGTWCGIYMQIQLRFITHTRLVLWTENHDRHLLRRLGHAWSVPSSLRLCWFLRLNYGHIVFRRLIGLYIIIFFRIRSPSVCRTWYLHRDLYFRIILFGLKILISSQIFVFLIWSFLM
jgi:hypothetical protein